MNLAAIHIDGVAERLERIERDADRQDHFQRAHRHVDADLRQQRMHRIGKEIEVLEKALKDSKFSDYEKIFENDFR